MAQFLGTAGQLTLRFHVSIQFDVTQCRSQDRTNRDGDIIKTAEHQDQDKTKTFGVPDQDSFHYSIGYDFLFHQASHHLHIIDTRCGGLGTKGLCTSSRCCRCTQCRQYTECRKSEISPWEWFTSTDCSAAASSWLMRVTHVICWLLIQPYRIIVFDY